MIVGSGGARSSASLAGLVAAAFVRRELPDVTEAEIAVATDHVDQSLAEMPDLMRLGVRIASGFAYVALSALGGAPYRRQARERQSRSASRLATSGLPILSEFARLARGLGLVAVLEERTLRGEV